MMSKPDHLASRIPMSKARLHKNLVVVSFAIFFYMSAVMPSNELQSSLNIKDGMGTNSMAVGGIIKLASQLFLPSFLIRRYGLKKTIFYSMLVGTFSFFGNFYPSMWTLSLSQVITGLGTTPKWAAKSVYVTLLAERHSEYTGSALYGTLGIFFGIYHSFYYSGYVGGNLLAFRLLKRNTTLVENFSSDMTSSCGREFCDSTAVSHNPNFKRPPDVQVNTLFGTFTVMTLVAALIVYFFMDDLPKRTSGKSFGKGCFDACAHLRKKEQLLLLPVCYFRGHFRSLLTTEFTKAYITCLWGMDQIGLVLLCFGVACGFCALTFGLVVRWTGRPPLFILAAFINLVILWTLLNWTPDKGDFMVTIFLAGLWGFSTAVWESQVAAMVGLLFPLTSEAAFTNSIVFDHLAMTVSHSFSAYVCMEPKVYLSLVLLVVAVVSYLTLEVSNAKEKTNKEVR